MKLPGTKFKRQKRRWLFTQQMADMRSTFFLAKSLDAKNLQEVKGIFDKYLEHGLLKGY